MEYLSKSCRVRRRPIALSSMNIRSQVAADIAIDVISSGRSSDSARLFTLGSASSNVALLDSDRLHLARHLCVVSCDLTTSQDSPALPTVEHDWVAMLPSETLIIITAKRTPWSCCEKTSSTNSTAK
eukprot:1120731-Pleurochrysis_carterae.AAC.1